MGFCAYRKIGDERVRIENNNSKENLGNKLYN